MEPPTTSSNIFSCLSNVEADSVSHNTVKREECATHPPLHPLVVHFPFVHADKHTQTEDRTQEKEEEKGLNDFVIAAEQKIDTANVKALENELQKKNPNEREESAVPELPSPAPDKSHPKFQKRWERKRKTIHSSSSFSSENSDSDSDADSNGKRTKRPNLILNPPFTRQLRPIVISKITT